MLHRIYERTFLRCISIFARSTWVFLCVFFPILCREYHDNTPSHSSITLRKFPIKKFIAVLPHPLYSLVLAFCDYFLSPKLKTKLRDRHFGSVENVQKIYDVNAAHDNRGKMLRRMAENRMRPQGTYFEGDNITLWIFSINIILWNNSHYLPDRRRTSE